ncbi:response regulator [Pontibacillus sp. HMF3514]|uniref:response regulator n=1 Tax=Pontibacillus sp. HMF3514 TaxID=2692425 RepID=UPI00131FE3D0|nr:response regulator [Pontibacillus sp. HMF3514]QHE52866.1 response regulator [Pontibacillus sp. HMF3514]
MKYFITDDDLSIRTMITDIIEGENLGEVVGERDDGIHVDDGILLNHKVDILFIDILMPERDGIETIRSLSRFNGKIIMISQVESKEFVGEAFSLGIEYYINKPINRVEVISVLQKVRERIQLENSIENIQHTLRSLHQPPTKSEVQPYRETNIQQIGNHVLSDLGIIGEKGSQDLLNILEVIYEYEKSSESTQFQFPSLKEVFSKVAEQKLGVDAQKDAIKKEVKAIEQRVRRAIQLAIEHIASLGLSDYLNPTFEHYATKLFEFSQVTKMIHELKKDQTPRAPNQSVNTKKFVSCLYIEVKRQM